MSDHRAVIEEFLEEYDSYLEARLFIPAACHRAVQPPSGLPHIKVGATVYFLVSAPTVTMGTNAQPMLPPEAYQTGTTFAPEFDNDLVIGPGHAEGAAIEEIRRYQAQIAAAEKADIKALEERAATKARLAHQAELKKTLDDARSGKSGLYASAEPISQAVPMLVENLIGEKSTSLFVGPMDEFKTTILQDLAAHIAGGCTWQDREIAPHPVIWYAFEGRDMVPVRLQALEPRIKRKDPAWGDDKLPFAVRDRIPGDYLDGDIDEWRAEIEELHTGWDTVFAARLEAGEIPSDGKSGWEWERYAPDWFPKPVIFIDTLSGALDGEDEKGHVAVRFIASCRKLINDGLVDGVIIAHHPTKSGDEFAGHRAIAADTHGLFSVKRFGSITDKDRSYSGRVTPLRTKDIARPPSFTFDVEVVSIEGTTRSVAVLRDRATELSAEIKPYAEALAAIDAEEITPKQLNDCLDAVASEGDRKGDAARQFRSRTRKKLVDAGLLEPVLDDREKTVAYRVHQPT